MNEDYREFYKRIRPGAIFTDLGLNEEGEHEVRVSVRPEEQVCDFCSSTPVVCAFNAGPIRIPIGEGPDWGTKDPWAACEGCEPLVEGNRRGDLLERALRLLGPRIGVPTPIAREVLRLTHGKFWTAEEKSPG